MAQRDSVTRMARRIRACPATESVATVWCFQSANGRKWPRVAPPALAAMGTAPHGRKAIANSPEQVRMGAGAHQLQHIATIAIDQQPVGRDVTVTIALPGAFKRVIAIGRRQR